MPLLLRSLLAPKHMLRVGVTWMETQVLKPQHRQRRHRSSGARASAIDTTLTGVSTPGVAMPVQPLPPKPYFQQSMAMSSTTKESLTEATFSSFNLSNATQRALAEVLGYTHCTKVQAESMPVMLAGSDVVCKAKTGTGKTLAFLIPGIERVLSEPAGQGRISILIISPTRELAAQIAEEAKQILKFQRLSVQVMFGGNNIQRDITALQRQVPDVLVATPGRLNDHLENGNLLPKMMGNLRMLILDEADRLLDMGFRPAIEKLTRQLPPKHTRQNVMFSATYPQNIKELASVALRPQYELVDTVGEEETHAAEQVEQQYLVTSMADQAATLLAIIERHRLEDPNHKIMAFFVTARVTQFYCELFQALGINVLEMHSRKSQAQRTRAADQFRGSKGGIIMFSSDVSARGVDYPDVTLVLQLGLPMDKAQYIHRLGRTARAGKNGKGFLLLGDYERRFLNTLSDLPLSEAQPIQAQAMQKAQADMQRGLAAVDYQSKAQAYRTWLGFYKGFMKLCNWDPARLVATANEYAAVLGCPEPPPIEKKTIGKMGLKGVPGLNAVAFLDEGKRPQQQGRAFASPQRGQAAHSNGQVQGPARDQVDGFQSRGPYSSVPGQQGAPGQRSARQHGSWGAARGEGESARGSSHRQGPTRGKRHSYAAPY